MPMEKVALTLFSPHAGLKASPKVDDTASGEAKGQNQEGSNQEGSNVLPEFVTAPGDAEDVVQLPPTLHHNAVARQSLPGCSRACFRVTPNR